MGLFDKKYCDVCGDKIGLLGNRKLDDGNLCKACAAKLSPWFSDRRHSTVAEIKEQLDYREANKDKVAAFHSTRTIGNRTKVLLDEDAQVFMVTSSNNLAEANPDVLAYADCTGVDLDVSERRWEEKTRDNEGNEVSYNPPRWRCEFDYYVKIYVNNPYFDEIRFQLNSSSVDEHDFSSRENYSKEANEIKETLLNARQESRDQAVAAAQPQAVVTCVCCGATTTPDASGACEYCGGPARG